MAKGSSGHGVNRKITGASFALLILNGKALLSFGPTNACIHATDPSLRFGTSTRLIVLSSATANPPATGNTPNFMLSTSGPWKFKPFNVILALNAPSFGTAPHSPGKTSPVLLKFKICLSPVPGPPSSVTSNNPFLAVTCILLVLPTPPKAGT